MEIYQYPSKFRKVILALGAESAGNFSIFHKGKIYFSENFGDLLEDANFKKYKRELDSFLKKNKIKPDIILTDLHPLYKTTILGKELGRKYKAEYIQIQHHLAHIFSAIGDKKIHDTSYIIPDVSYGISLDGTGYGLDAKIWGGEIFKIAKNRTERIGHLENQTLIGADLAIQEPARMLISILSKFLTKEETYKHIKKYYSKNKFEVLYAQLRQNFNCQETSSTGRILDAVSVLLGFAGNTRKYKHEAAELLEKKSTKPYTGLKPKIVYDKKEKLYVLQTTPLFEYLIKNLGQDKKRLASTAQQYIAQGLYEIIKLQTKNKKLQTFMAGGIANNKIISSFLESKGAYKNKATPVGDAGLSFGQIASLFEI